jgi:hypothetical protein
MFPEASPTSAYFSTAIQGKDFQRLPGVTYQTDGWMEREKF